MSASIFCFKQWIGRSLGGLLALLLPIAIINYTCDPLWIFGHFATPYKHEFDERVQKTNALLYAKVEFDGVLLGSSRSTYIPINHFEGIKFFNYSVASLTPWEYSGFIQNAKTIKGSHLEMIWLGLDFFSYLDSVRPSKSADSYLKESQAPFYLFRNLLSFDALKISLKNLRIVSPSHDRLYDRHYHAITAKRNPKEFEANLQKSLKLYREKLLNHAPLGNYKSLLQKLKKENPRTHFVVFTTPETSALQKVIQEKNLYPHYEEWLRVATEIFGEIYHFNYLNPITMESEANFYDSHHFYPHVGRLIIESIACLRSRECQSSFGIKLTHQTLPQQLELLKTINLQRN